ncbi:hypothetical protein HanPI659440_Chr15g0583001 [Helianthus annuus]|nr:hypothetical protein HanPI659440_Chr15g0583001 [Helianthus annuus]
MYSHLSSSNHSHQLYKRPGEILHHFQSKVNNMLSESPIVYFCYTFKSEGSRDVIALGTIPLAVIKKF